VQFRDVLAQRRMHRAFLPDPIPREALERIARSVRRAPSGGFSQGQSLVVVTEPDTRERIAGAMDEYVYVEKGWPPFMTTAPAHIVVCASEARYHERYNKPDKLTESGGVEIHWPVPYWYVDAGAAMMLVLLAAIEEGLAAAFTGHPEQEERLREILGLPDDVVPIGVAFVGRPAPDPKSDTASSRFREQRRPLADCIRWERW
jgi:nitroreductase